MKLISIILLILSLNSCAFINRQANLAAQRRVRFTVDMNSPQTQVGQIEAQFNNLFPVSGIRTISINVIYFPYEDAVCLQYRLNTYTYHQFWHRAGREAYLKALQQYNSDFEGRKLRERNHRTKNQYGTVEECYLIWQQAQLRLSDIGDANMDIELGYYFRDRAPFFAITQLPAHYQSPTFFRDDDMISPEIPIFFTRAQAEELAEFFSQDFLQTLAPDMRPSSRIPSEVIPDSY